jgi:hypothetical protein
MRDYGKVYATFWSSPTTSSLSDNGKLLALYLMTCAHSTIAGVFRLPDGYVAEDLNWGLETVKQGFQELHAKGFATRCEATKWVWVTKHLEWNPPENPNQRTSVRKLSFSVPEQCTWRLDFITKNAELLGIEAPAPANPLPTLVKPFLNQEQEQEQEQKTGTGAEAGAEPKSPASTAPAPATTAAAADAPVTKRGTRLSEDWALPKLWGEWALAKYPHWTADIVRGIAGQFRNHWVAKTGKDATKLDWKATFENWCDSDITQRAHPKPVTVQTISDQVNESAAKAERIRIAMAAGGGAVFPAAQAAKPLEFVEEVNP